MPDAVEGGLPRVGAKLVAKVPKSPCMRRAAWAVGRGTQGAISRTTRWIWRMALWVVPTLRA